MRSKTKQDDSGALVPHIGSTYQKTIGAEGSQGAILNDLINVIGPFCSYATLIAFGSTDKKHQQVISNFLMQSVAPFLANELDRRAFAAAAESAAPHSFKMVVQRLKKITSNTDEITYKEMDQAKSQCHVAMQLLHSMKQQNENRKIAINVAQTEEATKAIKNAETAFVTWFNRDETGAMLQTITKTPAGLAYFENTMTEFFVLAADGDSAAILIELNKFLFRKIGYSYNDRHGTAICYYPAIIQHILQKVHSSNSNNPTDTTTWFDAKIISNSPSSVNSIEALLTNILGIIHLYPITCDPFSISYVHRNGANKAVELNDTDFRNDIATLRNDISTLINQFQNVFDYWLRTNNIAVLQRVSSNAIDVFPHLKECNPRDGWRLSLIDIAQMLHSTLNQLVQDENNFFIAAAINQYVSTKMWRRSAVKLTMLHYACIKSDWKTIEALFNAGGDPTLRVKGTYYYGDSYSSFLQSPNALEILIKRYGVPESLISLAERKAQSAPSALQAEIQALKETVKQQGEQLVAQGKELAEQRRELAEQRREFAEQRKELAEQGKLIEMFMKKEKLEPVTKPADSSRLFK